MDLSLPRGMRDLEPNNYEALEKMRASFMDAARIFGFRIMEPSTIEMIQTLEAKSGVGVRDEVYHFKDKGGRDVGLRFDLTVGLTRYVVSNRSLPLPVKIGSFSDIWRYDEPQHGRYRWFYQWDAEIFGVKSPYADAEIIDFTSTIFNMLGLKSTSIEIGDRNIIEEFIRTRLDVSDEKKILTLLRAVDKLERKTVEEVHEEYTDKGVDKELLKLLTEFGSLRDKPEIVLRDLNDKRLKKVDDLTCLVDSLKARNVSNILLNMGIVRGLDYYSGVVFEVFENEKRNLGALAGGGRYDILPRVFGRGDIGATGVAGGVERTLLASSSVEDSVIDTKKVFVGYAGEEMAKVAVEIASILRQSGVATDIEFSGRSLKKQLEYASSFASLFVIVGGRDFVERKVTIRNMKSGEETKIPLQNISDKILNYL